MTLDFRFKPFELMALAVYPLCYWATRGNDYGLILCLFASGVMVPFAIYNGFRYIGKFEQNLPIFSIESLSYVSVWLWASFFAFRIVGSLYIYTVIPLVALGFFVAFLAVSLRHKKIIVMSFLGASAYTSVGIYLCYTYFASR